MNNRADDITNEPHARGVCRKCGEIAHSPYRCYEERRPITMCKKCGRSTGRPLVQLCDVCVPANTLAGRKWRDRQVTAA